MGRLDLAIHIMFSDHKTLMIYFTHTHIYIYNGHTYIIFHYSFIEKIFFHIPRILHDSKACNMEMNITNGMIIGWFVHQVPVAWFLSHAIHLFVLTSW